VDVVSTAIKQDPDAFKFAEASLRANREMVLLAVKCRGKLLRYADTKFWADRELVMLAMAEDGMLLKLASAELQADREVVQQALRNNPQALKYADGRLRSDRTLVLGVVCKDGMALKYAGDSLQSDYDVVMTAGQQDSDAFKYARDNLKQDKQLEKYRWIGMLEQAPDVVRLVEKAPDRIKADRNFMLAARRLHGGAVEHVYVGLAGDCELEIMRWVDNLSKLNRHDDVEGLMQRAPNHVRANRDVMLVAVRKDGMMLKYADESIRGNRDLLLEAIKRIGIRSMSDVGLVGNESYREMMLKVVLTNGIFLALGDEPSRSDRDIVFRAVRSNPEALQFAIPGLRKDRELVLTAIRRKGLMLSYAHDRLKNDIEVAFEAVKQDPDALQFASDMLKRNKDLVIFAARHKPSAVNFAKGGLERDKHVQKAAGTWHGTEDQFEEEPPKLPVILSLAHSLQTKETTKLGKDFQAALNNHWFFSDVVKMKGWPKDPNSWQANVCGKSSCIGTPETCRNDASNDPNFHCWRVAVGHHISQCVESGGAMFQVEEDGRLTPEQEIQLEMARNVNLKVFRTRARKGQRCTADSIWRLGRAVRVWRQETPNSMRTEVVDMH